MGEIGMSKTVVHTKANPHMGEEGLSYEGVKKQLNESLKALKRDKVELFYLHMPDHKTPIKETLRAVNDLHKEGKFRDFGVSNFAAWQVAEIQTICQYEGWVAPTVYQGFKFFFFFSFSSFVLKFSFSSFVLNFNLY